MQTLEASYHKSAARTHLPANRRLLALVLVLLAPATVASAADPPNAPLEPVNRKVQWFNDQVDRFVLRPLALGFDFIAPDPLQESLKKAVANARYPMHLANNLLQGKFRGAGEETARFLLNTTAGVGGFFDPAAKLGLEAHPEDFGQTLGTWGVPAGPYLVLPILGPANPRDALGLVGDAVANAPAYFTPWYLPLAVAGGDAVNRRSLADEAIRGEREDCIDCYSFLRNAYLSHREAQIDGGDSSEHLDDDLYDDPEASDDGYEDPEALDEGYE